MTNISGANMVWMATAHTYLGLLEANITDTAAAIRRIFSQLYETVGGTAGFKADGSYFQHDHGQSAGGKLVG
jgi:hypothetical protein